MVFGGLTIKLPHADTTHDSKPPGASPAAAASPAVNFTFVNQAEDLDSLTTRKITNQQQRHVIRSHVMKSVRQEELARGKKRTIGRARSKRTDSDKSQGTSSDSDYSHKNTSPLPSSVTIEEGLQKPQPQSHGLECDNQSRNSHTLGTPCATTAMTYTPGVHEFDPLDTLPCTSLSHKPLQRLLEHCFDVLLPLTFTAEINPRDRLARLGVVLQSKISSPPTFLGFMATAAAHRAIFHGRHKDLAPSSENHDDLITDCDYKKVKHEALVAVRRKVEQPETIDQFMVDACFGLISAATVVGNFEEARLHLKGVAQLMSVVGVSQDSMLWLPLANVKVSVGLLSRPLLQLPWSRQPISHEILQRISPSPSSGMARLGSGFEQLDELSKPLKDLVEAGRDVCNFCELVVANPQGLSSAENATLRQKATELEFDLLAYPYETEDFYLEHSAEPQLPALEAVVRLAALGSSSIAPHTVMPSTGLGRALTHHQKRAIQQWLRETNTNCGVSEMKAVTWALFMFTQNALNQPEEGFFSDLLLQYTHELRLLSWQDIENTVCGYLYVPSLQSSIWQAIWMASSQARIQRGR
ncbi:hypothetical protein A1O1_03673 [Capronia coronata CBS 617.96]|uniref:Uncharacterized protein n=1 Tax=Capronia coronata CBS 617.96 TaxID=1182541 RepID=W9YLL6_9EURO|nr:uncharacterized protein A1O1_03673 [Capronia coronata CBS 617.96]EXJ90570.1 hypothetical protein A1O1_03673 [Capronia coronata CBS 617.96]